MTRAADRIARLAQLARLKSDQEMRRFSAYRAHVIAAQGRIMALEDELQSLYASDAANDLSGARLSNALAGDRSRALSRAERELEQMMPGFEAARAVALREFGRLQVLRTIHEEEIRTARRTRIGRQEGRVRE